MQSYLYFVHLWFNNYYFYSRREEETEREALRCVGFEWVFKGDFCVNFGREVED